MSQAEFYELIQPRLRFDVGAHTFTADEIIEFAREFDPQAFHLSEEGAAASHFGRLCASGWHTISVWMRLNVDNAGKAIVKATGYKGTPQPLGPSPGVRDIKWTLPVYVGDTIHYSTEVLDKRPSTNRPGWSIVSFTSEGHNQDGAKVLSMVGAMNMRME